MTYRPRHLVLILVWLATCHVVSAQQAQTAKLEDFNSNNTSAVSAVNGAKNRAAGFDFGAVSKVPIRNLLGNGSNVRVYAHLMPWFGAKGHIDIGYDSARSDQVYRQVSDMLSRGIDGVIVYWTGPPQSISSAHTNDTVLKIMKEAEQHRGFEFAVQEDKEALKQCAKRGCDLTSKLITDLQYAAKTFFGSPAYMTMNGRPLLFFFGLEEYKSSIDWNRVRASVPGNPLFVFRNSVGFDYTQSDGAFAWNAVDRRNPNDLGIDYLRHFYQVAGRHSSEVSIGSVYAGFNDQLASWGKSKVINRNCGDTWLRTFDEARRNMAKFSALQIVTWNDYEEGSQIEPGIDNCVSVQASVSDHSVVWTIHGSRNTIHHFAVWASSDNNNFRLVRELPASASSAAFAEMGLSPGQYSFAVQAIGQPSMLNHVSNTVTAVFSSTMTPPSDGRTAPQAQVAGRHSSAVLIR
jgi:hypothetical protein